jgi:hypothetical protein
MASVINEIVGYARMLGRTYKVDIGPGWMGMGRESWERWDRGWVARVEIGEVEDCGLKDADQKAKIVDRRWNMKDRKYE